MQHPRRQTAGLIVAIAGFAALLAFRPAASPAQSAKPPAQAPGQEPSQYESTTSILLHTPVSGLFPGGVDTVPKFSNPAVGDPAAIQRGRRYFDAMNCVGCHAANGGGGMGPALSNRFFKFGGSPANIYLTIVQGRSQGMPAWGSLLPPEVIWDLVAYVTQISQAPVTQWGTTISPSSPNIQQVPAEFLKTDKPWDFTEPFTEGQRPAAPAPGE